jgi:methylenetetrahydrofolate dehydrogenase (NADP+)/methenyltetrahydrofolate cyclohydrolase
VTAAGGIVAVDGRARILDGRSVAAAMFDRIGGELAAHAADAGRVPSVAVVIVGEDPASGIYTRQILRSADRVGSSGTLVELDAATDEAALRAALRDLSSDPSIGGVIVQQPLPAHLELRRVIGALDPRKDIDGLHPFNAGLVSRGHLGFAPSCAEAALVMLRVYEVPLAGRPAVVVGRSNVVGRPAQLMLIREHATVTVCHRQTVDLRVELRRAEVVVVAAGAPHLVRGEDVRPGAVLIDCGINVLSDGAVVGDVDMASVAPVAAAVTPVPGGVGPVTNAVLMDHLARAVHVQAAGDFEDALPTGTGTLRAGRGSGRRS